MALCGLVVVEVPWMLTGKAGKIAPVRDLSGDQLLAEHLKNTPDDDEARLAFARVLVARGQVELAHGLLADLAKDAPAPLRALRDKARKTPAPLAGVPAGKLLGPRWRLSGCLSALALLVVFALAVGAATVSWWGAELARDHEIKVTLAQLRDPDGHARVAAAARLTRLHESERPDDVGIEIDRALELAKLEPADAIASIPILRAWGRLDGMALGLRHPSPSVRRAIAHSIATSGYQGSCHDIIAQAALADRELAVDLVGSVALSPNPRHVDVILTFAASKDPALRDATTRAVLKRASDGRKLDPRLAPIALEALHSNDRSELEAAKTFGLLNGDREALNIFVAELRAKPGSPREIDRWARKLLAYSDEDLSWIAANERSSTYVLTVVDRAIELKRRKRP
jgi:hypothetical protein